MTYRQDADRLFGSLRQAGKIESFPGGIGGDRCLRQGQVGSAVGIGLTDWSPSRRRGGWAVRRDAMPPKRSSIYCRGFAGHQVV
jgi:hypothetical protein